jgi:hypothetical protein
MSRLSVNTAIAVISTDLQYRFLIISSEFGGNPLFEWGTFCSEVVVSEL